MNPVAQPWSGPTTDDITAACDKPAAGWKDGDQIRLELSAVAGQPACSPVSVAAVITLLPAPSLRVEAVGTPEPVCNGATTAVASFRVTANSIAGGVVYGVDSQCITSVTGELHSWDITCCTTRLIKAVHRTS